MTIIANMSSAWPKPVKKAIATLIFATTGALVGAPILDMAIWKGAAAAGIGALINFIYRYAEQYLSAE